MSPRTHLVVDGRVEGSESSSRGESLSSRRARGVGPELDRTIGFSQVVPTPKADRTMLLARATDSFIGMESTIEIHGDGPFGGSRAAIFYWLVGSTIHGTPTRPSMMEESTCRQAGGVRTKWAGHYTV